MAMSTSNVKEQAAEIEKITKALRASILNNEDLNDKDVLNKPVADFFNKNKEPYADSFLDGPFPKDSFVIIRPDESDFVSDIMHVNDVLKNRVTKNNNDAVTPLRRKPRVLKTLIRSEMLKDDKKLDLVKVMAILNGMKEVEIVQYNNPKLVGRVDSDAGLDYSKLYLFFKYHLPEIRDNCPAHPHPNVHEKNKESIFDFAIREDGRLYLVYCQLSELAAQILVVKVAGFLHDNGLPFIEVWDLRIQIISRLARGHVGYIPKFENKDLSNIFLGSNFDGLLKEVIVTKAKEKILLVTPNDRSSMYMFYVLKADGSFFIGGIRSVPAIEEMFRTFYNLILYGLHPKYQNTDRVLDSGIGIDEGKENDVEKKSSTPEKKITKENDVEKKSATPEKKSIKEKDVEKKPTSTLSPTTPTPTPHTKKDKNIEKKSTTLTPTSPDKKKDKEEKKETPVKEKVKRPKARKDI